jgi:hypothetical protein
MTPIDPIGLIEIAHHRMVRGIPVPQAGRNVKYEVHAKNFAYKTCLTLSPAWFTGNNNNFFDVYIFKKSLAKKLQWENISIICQKIALKTLKALIFECIEKE